MNGNEQRVAEFREAVAGLEIKKSSGFERSLGFGGIALVVVGIVLIMVGYSGAAGTDFTPEAISFLISGGVLGLALVIVGVGLYVRYSMARFLRFWLLRNLFEQSAQTDRLVAALGVAAGADLEPGGPTASPKPADTQPV